MQSLKWIDQGILNLQRDIRKIDYNLMNKLPNFGMKIRIFTTKNTDYHSNNYAKFEVNWPRVLNLQPEIWQIAYNFMNKVH
jgi:hypothetical protein